MCAVGDPGPELAAELAHPVLDIELLAAVARPRQREPRQRAGSLHAGELVLVEKITVAALMAEEQPVAPGCFARHALVEKGAERRDPGAGADHDDGRGWIGRKSKVLRFLDIDLELVAWAHALGQEGRGDAEPCSAVDGIAYRVDAERHAVAIDPGRAGDGIEARLQRIERLDEGFRIGPHAGKFLDGGEHVERFRVAVGILADGERLRFLPPLASGDVGEQLKQHVGGGAEGNAVDQHIAQRPPTDREIPRSIERGEHGVDERGIIGRKDAKGIADRIIDSASREIELNMPGLLPRARFVEARARQKYCLGRMLARTSRGGCRCSRSSGRRRRLALDRRRPRQVGAQRVERAGGFLAARHAEI